MCDAKATAARNEYLLAMAGANAHQIRFYSTDLPDLMKVSHSRGHLICLSPFIILICLSPFIILICLSPFIILICLCPFRILICLCPFSNVSIAQSVTPVWLTAWLVDLLFVRFIRWLVDQLSGWLADQLSGWLVR